MQVELSMFNIFFVSLYRRSWENPCSQPVFLIYPIHFFFWIKNLNFKITAIFENIF